MSQINGIPLLPKQRYALLAFSPEFLFHRVNNRISLTATIAITANTIQRTKLPVIISAPKRVTRDAFPSYRVSDFTTTVDCPGRRGSVSHI